MLHSSVAVVSMTLSILTEALIPWYLPMHK